MRLLHGLMTLVALMAVAMFTNTAAAQGQTKLRVGDTAPPLYITDWINGSATMIDPDKVYVVEFWATWCGPCKLSIPHLNDLSKKYASRVTFIGVSDEELNTVKPFVQAKGPAMSYLVGVDQDKKTSKGWREAAGQNGIPSAFIVNKERKIVWIGHPMDEQFERVIAAVVEGKYDPKAENQARPAIDAARRAAKLRNYREAYSHYETAIAINPKVFSNLALERYKLMLNDAGDTKGAADYGRTLLTSYADNGLALGDFAVMILTDSEIKDRDTELAQKAATQMISAAGRNDAQILSRLATVQFATGMVKESVDTQMEAWMMAPEASKAAFKVKLDQYRNALGGSQAKLTNSN